MQDARLVAVSRYTLFRAKQEIQSCEACNPRAETPFAWVLGRVSEHPELETDYIMSEPVLCPGCARPVLEDTLVEPS
jgi:hypothetical protein